MKKQLVFVQFKNTEPFLYEFKYKENLNEEQLFNKILQYFIDKHGFDEEEDYFTFINEVFKVKL
jgi:hypothetical protein